MSTLIYTKSNPEILQEIGRRVRAYRLQQNLSAADLAERAGVSRLTVVKTEAGRNPTLDTLVRVLRGLGRLDALISWLPAPLVSPLALLDQTLAHVRTRAYRRKSSPKH